MDIIPKRGESKDHIVHQGGSHDDYRADTSA